MDFLDTRDSNVSKKRSRRVRSWYLYEQFKSLEQNQVEAVEKLKERSYQDKILRQELSERRARRKLYDQIGLTASESINEKNSRHNKTEESVCTSSEHLFGNYDELQENEYVIRETEVLSEFSHPDSLNDQDDDYKTIEDHIITTTATTSVTDIPSEETMIGDYRSSATTTVHPIDSHFDAVKEQLNNLEQMTELCDEADGISVSMCSDDDFKNISKKDISVYTQDNSLLSMWSKLVTFAYQVIELNNGSCYYDYGSQLLTAVLACDVIRRGINKMCDILQPYVTPIKFTTETYSDSHNYCHKSVRRKKSQNNNNKKTFCKIRSKFKPKQNNFARKYRSEHRQYCARSTDNKRRNKIKCRNSEPWRRDQRSVFYFDCTSTKSSSSIWPDFSDDSSKNLCRNCGSRVIKPVFKLSQYIDSILQEIEEKYD